MGCATCLWRHAGCHRPPPLILAVTPQWYGRPLLAQVKAVEFGGVLSDNLPLLCLADVLKVAFYNIARMRPGRGGVGVVGGPHHVVHPNPMPADDPEGVIDEGAVHLAPE